MPPVLSVGCESAASTSIGGDTRAGAVKGNEATLG